MTVRQIQNEINYIIKNLEAIFQFSFVILWCIGGWFSDLWESKADPAFVEL